MDRKIITGKKFIKFTEERELLLLEADIKEIKQGEIMLLKYGRIATVIRGEWVESEPCHCIIPAGAWVTEVLPEELLNATSGKFTEVILSELLMHGIDSVEFSIICRNAENRLEICTPVTTNKNQNNKIRGLSIFK